MLLSEGVCSGLELGEQEQGAGQGGGEEEGKARCQEGLIVG